MFWKNASLICQVFLKLLTPKDTLIQMHNRASFWKSFGSKPVNEFQKHLKSAKKYLDSIFSSFFTRLSSKKLFSIRSGILQLLVNTLIPNCKYSGSIRDNLQLTIQIKLSKKPSDFCVIVLKFPESTWNVQCFEKK